MNSTLQTPARGRWLRLVAPAIAVAALAACASHGPNAKLDQARTQVNRIATQADVARLAPLELKAAQDSLARGEQKLKKDGDGPEVNHIAYLTSQRVEIAQAVTRSRLADEQLKTGNEQATQLRLSARTAEAEQARAQAAAAQAQAARSEADAARSQSQAANAQAAAAAAAAQAASAQSKLAAMQQKLRDIEAQQSERGLIVTLGDLLFETGKSTLLPGAGARMDKLAGFLAEFPDRKLLVEGHTDSTGGAALNQRLSEDRAAAVKNALVSRGVAADRIHTVGYGPAYPVASNASTEGRAQNRRVEVVIADDKGVMKPRR